MKKEIVHIALDIDKTLAFKEIGSPPNGGPIGEAVPNMIKNIYKWLEKGYKISIWSARVARFDKFGKRKMTSEINRQRKLIQAFLKESGLPEFDITAEKYGYFTHFVDDKAVAVELNTGNILWDQSTLL